MKQTNIKIFTLNIRSGGGERAKEILELVIKNDYDILILTEFRENKNSKLIRKVLFENKFEFSSSIKSFNGNHVAIFSKYKFLELPTEKLDQKDKHRIIQAKFSDFSIFAVYFAQKNEKKELFNYFLNLEETILSKPVFIIGDFNTGVPFKDEEKNTFYCSDLFINLQENFKDAWRTRNLDKKEFSWFSNQGNSFRIDHVLATNKANQMISDINYDHSYREKKLSDHSALIVRLSY